MNAAVEQLSPARRWLFVAAWALAWPLRMYLQLTPAHRGRGLIEWTLLHGVLSLAPQEFVTPLPGGATIALRYRERIGVSTLIHGRFEAAETDLLRELARPGSTAVDVGANVGIFTIPLALAVGPHGRVLAIEPTPETVARLRGNLRRNELENVDIVEAALGAEPGTARIALAEDSAYNSTAAAPAAEAGGSVVRIQRLDDIWERAGRPDTSVVKVDVEGAEVDVLAGASELLRVSRPAVLVEAAEAERVDAVTRLLEEHRFRRVPAPGFQSWNLLFLPDETEQLAV